VSTPWATELFSRLLDHSWDARLPADLRARTSSPGLARADVRLNLVDLEFDLEKESVTIFGLWAEGDEMPEATVTLAAFWRMVNAKADGQDWRAHLPV
jgi:hypothetical protein